MKINGCECHPEVNKAAMLYHDFKSSVRTGNSEADMKEKGAAYKEHIKSLCPEHSDAFINRCLKKQNFM